MKNVYKVILFGINNKVLKYWHCDTRQEAENHAMYWRLLYEDTVCLDVENIPVSVVVIYLDTSEIMMYIALQCKMDMACTEQYNKRIKEHVNAFKNSLMSSEEFCKHMEQSIRKAFE